MIPVNEMYRSRFLKADDLQGKIVSAQIEFVEMEELGDKRELKYVAHFENGTRPMVLNKGNSLALADRFGNDPGKWSGRAVELYSEKVQFQGRLVSGLRIRPKPDAGAAVQDKKSPAPAIPGTGDPGDDWTVL